MVRLERTVIENRVRVQPHHANNLGTAHGGNVLKWMDEVGAMSAMRFAGNACVTAHINQVDFERPVQIGDIAFVRGYVYAAGTSSVRVRLQVFNENPLTGDAEATTESYFVFVAIDSDLKPIPVPDLEITTEDEERMQVAAMERETIE